MTKSSYCQNDLFDFDYIGEEPVFYSLVRGQIINELIDDTVDFIPVNKFIGNVMTTDRVVGNQVFNGLVGEYDAPAESITRAISFIDRNLVIRIQQFHANSSVEPGGSTAQGNNMHLNLRQTWSWPSAN